MSRGKPPIPLWLTELLPGSYTLTELAIISGSRKSVIVRMLKRINVSKEYVRSPKGGNFSQAIYKWEGNRAEK